MRRIALMGLLRIELPSQDINLCDGGFMEFGGETFRSSDPLFGTVGSVDSLGEGVGDEVPALDLVMLPPGTAAVTDLSQPGYQRSRVRFWIGEYDPDDGTLDGADLMFDGQIDQTTLTVGRDRRELAMSIVSTAEKLFERNAGNSLNPTWHKSVWPGETGHDNGTGLTTPVAWGVENASGANGSSRPLSGIGFIDKQLQ